LAKIQFNPKKVHCLIVEDHAPMRKAIKRVISDFDFAQIHEASNGEDAMEVLDNTDVHFIILDLFLPKMHGFEIIKNIRDRDLGSDVPILVVTGEASREDIVKSADLGANGYLLKPFQTQQLALKCTEILNSYFAPGKLLGLIRLAEHALIAEDYVEADDLASQAMTVNNDSMRARHCKAMALIGLGQTKEAITLLHQSIVINPSYFKNYRTVSDALIKAGQKAEGIEALQKELELNPKQPQRQIKMGRLMTSINNYDAAIEHFRLALQEDPKISEALMGMGRAYALNENLDKSFYYFKRLRRYHPENTKSLEAMVKFALDNKDIKRAEMALKDEKAANPKRVDTYIVLAKLYASSRRSEQAMNTIEQALKLEPGNLDALRFKGDLLAHTAKLDEAIKIYKFILKRKQDPVVFSKLGKAYLKLGDYAHAIVTYHRLMTMHYDPPGCAMGLGEAYYQTGQLRKAFHCFRTANRLGVSGEKLKKMLLRCQRVILARSVPTHKNAS